MLFFWILFLADLVYRCLLCLIEIFDMQRKFKLIYMIAFVITVCFCTALPIDNYANDAVHLNI